MARDGHTTQAGGPEADLPRFVPRFVVDRNVGRLATWLRAMGYDTLFPADADDNQLVRIALRESRVIVTRDGGLARRRLATTGQISVVLVEHDDLRSQLRQVVYILGLGLPGEGRFSRCVRCNEPLGRREKESVLGLVPPYVYRTQQEFMGCSRCGRVYWKGTHWANMRGEMARIAEQQP